MWSLQAIVYDLHHLHAHQTFSDPSCSVIEARLESFLPRSEFTWKTVLGSQNVNFFFPFLFLNYGPLKMRGNIWLAVSTQLKSQHLWWYKGSLMHIAWVTCLEAPLTICWKIDTAFGATYAAMQMIWLSGKSLACDAKQHSACLQENIKVKVSENWMYPKSRPLDRIWCIMKQWIWQRKHRWVCENVYISTL